jgi:hypothetical protein
VTEKAQRKALLAEYKQHRPAAGVYRIVNQRTQRALLGSSLNLPSVQAKLEFARSTNTPSALDHRLGPDIRQFGLAAFTFEVLEILETTPEMTPAQIQADLAALETLWRERQDPDRLY